jgi:hypothetical protein
MRFLKMKKEKRPMRRWVCVGWRSLEEPTNMKFVFTV